MRDEGGKWRRPILYKEVLNSERILVPKSFEPTTLTTVVVTPRYPIYYYIDSMY